MKRDPHRGEFGGERPITFLENSYLDLPGCPFVQAECQFDALTLCTGALQILCHEENRSHGVPTLFRTPCDRA